jgi:hypothetical protein
LNKRFPEHTFIQSIILPEVRAELVLNPQDSPRAIEEFRAASAYEMGRVARFFPAYLRGQAYLAGHKGTEAAAEFQKIINHREIVQNNLYGAVAHLQLGHAYAMQGDTAKAAYQDFLTLWKDADPDVPILVAAKAEYAKLQ